MSGPQIFHGEIEWMKLPACGYIQGEANGIQYTISKDPKMTPFLSRVYDCKHRFECEHDIQPTQLFLGPKEMMELKEYIADLDRMGLLFVQERTVKQGNYTLAGMTIIGLSSDGMRAGVSEV